MVGIAHDFLKVGRLSGMLEGYSIPEAEERSIQLPASVTARFEAVQGLIDELEAHDASRQVPLTEALQYLNRTYRIVKYFAKKRGVLSGHVSSANYLSRTTALRSTDVSRCGVGLRRFQSNTPD